MKFRESKHGGKILQHKNYEYWKIRTYANKCVLWKCSMFQKCGCTAHVITRGNTIGEDNGDDHNHDPVNVGEKKEEVAVLETSGESGSTEGESDDSEEDASEEDGEDIADQEEEDGGQEEDGEQEEDTDVSVEDIDDDEHGEASEGEDDDDDDESNSEKIIRLLTRIYKEIKRGNKAMQNVERDDETDGDKVVTTEDYLQQLNKKRRLDKLDDVYRSQMEARKRTQEMGYKH
jgi:hypothetical protein